MPESVEQKIESGQDSRVTSPETQVTVFEPEILAFCCEH
jgi:hypothetical protein